MKLSCLPLSFYRELVGGEMSIREFARAAKECGLDAIDLSMMMLHHHTPVYLKELRKELEDEDIGINMIVTYPDFTHPDRVQRDREFEYLRRDIALVSDLGVPYLRILAGPAHPETGVEEGISWVVENFKKSTEVAERFKVQLVYENHSITAFWPFPDFSLPSHIFLRIMEGINDTSITLNFDTTNTLVFGDDPVPILEKVIHKVETLHAADIARKGYLEPVVLGTGIVPFEKLFTILKTKGYDGWISLEEGSKTGIEGIRQSKENIERLWKAAG